MTDKELPPGNMDSLGKNPLRQASLNLVCEDSWSIYADGFRRAAELLIANIKSTYERNTVIFPILALYRQYAELTLKEIIAYGQYLEQHDIRQGGHNLKSLWASAKSYIRKHYRDFEKDQLYRIEQLVHELHELDPTSEATRYPFVKPKLAPNGQTRSFSYDAEPVNLDILAEKIRTLRELLHNVTNYLAVCQDLEAEFRADYYRGL